MDPLVRRAFADAVPFEAAWNAAPSGLRTGPNPLPEVAYFVGGGLLHERFCLFHNGGLPLLERRRGGRREEIVFLPGPEGDPTFPFTLRVHLSHAGVGEIRARYWRPAIRAPLVLASGDAGLLELPPVRAIWHAEGRARTGEAALRAILDHVLPWFEIFDDPVLLRERLWARDLPWVDLSTALELMLAEFGEREARRFLRAQIDPYLLRTVAPETEGYDLGADRVATIAAYYRL